METFIKRSAIAPLGQRLAIASVSSYQKYLSPHKGFSCAHRLAYGGESCSEYVKKLFIERDLMTALQMTPQRFRACHVAAKSLQSQVSGGCLVIPCCIPL